MALLALGVVYGDIGTSPLYALKETVAHGRFEPPVFEGGRPRADERFELCQLAQGDFRFHGRVADARHRRSSVRPPPGRRRG